MAIHIRFAGLYSGPTSTAYIFYQLGRIYPDLSVAGKSFKECVFSPIWSPVIVFTRERPVNWIQDVAGSLKRRELSHLAVSAVARRDMKLTTKLGMRVRSDATVSKPDNGASDEWLYGRSGYLYLLRLVQYGFAEHSQIQRQVQEAMDQTILRILDSLRPWVWHGKAYLGAAHGAIGIVTQIVLSGNFPSSLPPGSSDRLVQFCHGAPGFVLSLVPLRDAFPGPGLKKKLEAAFHRAQRCIWDRGLLIKDPCLCHGISSKALALEDPALREHFLSFTTREELEKRWHLSKKTGDEDSFHALYTGKAGRAWAWAELDSGLGCKCIGYNDLLNRHEGDKINGGVHR
ncbi:MAG: hypothetical protein M1823_001164 [Watsoniomyces obsoletus]|nr:MAG: hypothetical protein M1823_001164 [Watsoniomyces obsoletus]